MGVRIAGWGAALPDRIVDNHELCERYDLTEEWIVARTGILTRRIAGPDDTSRTLATEACANAIKKADRIPDDVEFIICATATPDNVGPAVASTVQDALGVNACGAHDVVAGCAGFMCALTEASALIEAGVVRSALVCGVELMSRICDYSDPKMAVIFGDGAGAVLLEATDGPTHLGPFALSSDGSRSNLLYVKRDTGLLHMEGREVFRHAVQNMATSVATVVEAAGLTMADIDLLVAHQANMRILDAVVDRLGLNTWQVFTNLPRIGNTSSASIPIALTDAVEEGVLLPGMTVALTAFGPGFVWGSAIVRW